MYTYMQLTCVWISSKDHPVKILQHYKMNSLSPIAPHCPKNLVKVRTYSERPVGTLTGFNLRWRVLKSVHWYKFLWRLHRILFVIFDLHLYLYICIVFLYIYGWWLNTSFSGVCTRYHFHHSSSHCNFQRHQTLFLLLQHKYSCDTVSGCV